MRRLLWDMPAIETEVGDSGWCKHIGLHDVQVALQLSKDEHPVPRAARQVLLALHLCWRVGVWHDPALLQSVHFFLLWRSTLRHIFRLCSKKLRLLMSYM